MHEQVAKFHTSDEWHSINRLGVFQNTQSKKTKGNGPLDEAMSLLMWNLIVLCSSRRQKHKEVLHEKGASSRKLSYHSKKERN